MHRLPRALRLRQQAPILRHITLQRNFSLIPRRKRPATLYRPNGEAVRYQAVRFSKPPLFNWRRVATIGIYTGIVYAYLSLIFRYLEVEIEILEDDETSQPHPQDEKAKEGEEVSEGGESGIFYADDDSTFIPMTWPTQIPRTYYKGSDPEWREFVKLAKDEPRHKKIQDELVQLVYAGSIQHPVVQRQLGKDPKVGKYWLDISFPDAPPPEYARAGIEVRDGFIAWSKQKVSQESQWRTTRALWPKAAFESLWATGSVLVGIQYRRVKQALGWEGRDPFSPEERYRHAVEMMEKQQRGRERKEVGNTQTPDGSSGAVVTSGSTSTSTPSSSDTAPSQSLTKPPIPTPTTNPLPWTPSLPLPSSPLPNTTDIPIAMHVFSAHLSKHWEPKKSEPPRGTFVVQGLVEVKGQKGRILFDVQSCYDPRGGKYVAVKAAVRNFKRWNQGPKGGP